MMLGSDLEGEAGLSGGSVRMKRATYCHQLKSCVLVALCPSCSSFAN